MPFGDWLRTVSQLSSGSCRLAIANPYANAARLWLTACNQRRPRRGASAARLSKSLSGLLAMTVPSLLLLSISPLKNR